MLFGEANLDIGAKPSFNFEFFEMMIVEKIAIFDK